MTKNKRFKWFGIFTFAIMLVSCFAITNNFSIQSVYASSAQELTSFDCLTVGVYKTIDEAHKIEVKTDGTIYYDETYALTATGTTEGVVLNGSIGKFYQINSHNFAIKDKITYTANSQSVVLADNTVWTMSGYAANETGSIELWRNGEKIGDYADFQSAISMAATTSDVIKLTENMTVTAGAVVDGKSITIDGGNFTLDKSNWANSVFVVVDGASLTINNLTIDGGATGFEVDYESVAHNTTSIPLVQDSNANDPVSNNAVISSTGDFKANNFNVSNTYEARGLRAYRGTVALESCDFIHNYAGNGAAMSIGSEFLNTKPEDYTIIEFKLNNCNFENNYAYKNSGGGGAIWSTNIKNSEIKNTNFVNNVANGNSNGGAILNIGLGASDGYDSPAEQYGLASGSHLFENCLFEGNYAGNDGSALHIEEGHTEFVNCIFRKNVGTQRNGGSVGVISLYSCREITGEVTTNKITDCIFEENEGAVSCIGDHGCLVKIIVKNSDFSGNKGLYSNLHYSASASFEDCTFTNEEVTNSVIDIRYAAFYPEIANVTLTNNTFEGTVAQNGNGSDIWIRCYGGANQEDKAEVEFVGENTCNALIKDGNDVEIGGVLTGNISTDTASAEKISIGTNASLVGEISYYGYSYTINYSDAEGVATSKALSLTIGKTYTAQEINELLGVTKENSILKFYTNNTYTTEWDYIADKDETIYAQWEEHTHDFETNYTIIAKGNGIHKQCSCGSTQTMLEINTPSDLTYNGVSKAVNVENNLDIAEENYSISYQYYYNNQLWMATNNPVNVGKYKAILTFTAEDSTEYVAELEFEIEKANYDLSNINFKDLKITYDGNAHSIEIEGTLPEGVTVTYINNGQTEAGSYLVTALFTSSNENYNDIASMYAILTIAEKVEETNLFPYILVSVLATTAACLGIVTIIAIIRKKKIK